MKESASCFVLSYRGGELTVYVMKKLNHNAVLIDDDGIEKIAMGKGIGFSAKVSKPFDVEDADKLFVLDSKEKIKRFSEIVSQIPIEFMDFAEEVIELIT
ncbi:CAT RNA binding domain-containing protein, partial [Enterococcus faecium]|nr:CAT RNA binding domain-containing protein [Enterococcus faecium]